MKTSCPRQSHLRGLAARPPKPNAPMHSQAQPPAAAMRDGSPATTLNTPPAVPAAKGGGVDHAGARACGSQHSRLELLREARRLQKGDDGVLLAALDAVAALPREQAPCTTKGSPIPLTALAARRPASCHRAPCTTEGSPIAPTALAAWRPTSGHTCPPAALCLPWTTAQRACRWCRCTSCALAGAGRALWHCPYWRTQHMTASQPKNVLG